MVLPQRAPRTRDEATALADLLRRETQAMPDPGPTTVARYRKRVPLTSWMVAPCFPCEGPPLPRFAGVRWPREVRGQISVLKGKKPHKQMELDNVPDSIPELHCYVLARRLEGQYRAALYNISAEVDIPSGELETTMQGREDEFRDTLIDAVRKANEAIPAEKAVWFLLEQGIRYQGAWDVIKALWDLLTKKKVKVHLEVPTVIAGYETEDFIVDEFRETFEIDAEIKVDALHWHAW